ncbi:hypothetical protein JTB14_012684 [Gonioctena quinquepunctata]|nr:hypothetical protein JTB14_012684 [Gonioctena quinquepunctata]
MHPMIVLNKLNNTREAGVPDECKKGLASACLKGTADTENLLTDSDSEAAGKEMVSPTIKIRVGEQGIETLLDSGSDVCAVSERFFDSLKGEVPNIPVLPLSNLSIAVPVGGETHGENCHNIDIVFKLNFNLHINSCRNELDNVYSEFLDKKENNVVKQAYTVVDFESEGWSGRFRCHPEVHHPEDSDANQPNCTVN